MIFSVWEKISEEINIESVKMQIVADAHIYIIRDRVWAIRTPPRGLEWDYYTEPFVQRISILVPRTQPTMFWSQRHNALDQWTNAMVHPGRPLYLPRCTHRVSFIGKCSNIPMFSVFRIVSQVMMKIQNNSLLFQPLITKNQGTGVSMMDSATCCYCCCC